MASRDTRLARYLRREVWAHGAGHRQRLAVAGVESGGLRSVADLARVPALPLTAAGPPTDLVLRPTARSLKEDGSRRMALRYRIAHAAGRSDRFDRRRLTPMYKPIQWVVAGGVPVGSSEADLDRLAGLGATWLTRAGVGRTDAIVSLVPPGPHLDAWQLALGARLARVPAVLLEPSVAPSLVAGLRPTVLVGHVRELTRIVEATPLEDVRTILVTGAPLEEGERRRLAARLSRPDAVVLGAWSPPGVRALWFECRGRTGLHTDPASEVVQLIDPLSAQPVPAGADGEVVWTALGWAGTVLVRLRTGVFATLHEGVCPACRLPGPRLVAHSAVPAFLGVLDRHPGVAVWQAELRDVDGDEELLVFLAPSPAHDAVELVREIDVHLSATQYVVLDEVAVAARVAAAGGSRLADLRGGAAGGQLAPGGFIAGS